jgi:hypothetical protein
MAQSDRVLVTRRSRRQGGDGMARRPDVPCAMCGVLLWSTSTSLPAGLRVCRPCRRARHEATCSVCGQTFEATWSGGRRRRTCSQECARASRQVARREPEKG